MKLRRHSPTLHITFAYFGLATTIPLNKKENPGGRSEMEPFEY